MASPSYSRRVLDASASTAAPVIFAGIPTPRGDEFSGHHNLCPPPLDDDIVEDREPPFSTRSEPPHLRRRPPGHLSPEVLQNQLAELEAALNHSKARERYLLESLETTKVEICEKNKRLGEKQQLLEAVEKEHRRVKASFRELMDATLDVTRLQDGSTQKKNRDRQQVASMEDVEDTPEPEATDKCGAVEPEKRSRRGRALDRTCEAYPGSRDRFESHHAHKKGPGRRRAQSVPDGAPTTTAREAQEEAWDLRQELQQTQELLESLRGTVSYAREVLQRNTALEEQCNDLESKRDEHVRDLYEEVSRARKERAEADAKSNALARELEGTRLEMSELHSELRALHEKSCSVKDLTADLQTAHESIEGLRDALGFAEAEKDRILAQWRTEKAVLTSELDVHRRLTTVASTAAAPVGGDDLAKRLGDLEASLLSERDTMDARTKALEEENVKLRSSVRSLTVKLDAATAAASNGEQRATEAETTSAALRKSLAAARAEAEAARRERDTLGAHADEAEELRRQLESERARTKTQAEQLQKRLVLIKESNDRFVELSERNSVLDKLLQEQQSEKEKLVGDHIKTSEVLYDQADSYRQRWQAANVELVALRKQVADHDESTRIAVQAAEIAKLRQIRQLKEQHAAAQRTLGKGLESEMMSLRDKHEAEIAELRRQREEKLDAMASQYERYLEELKALHAKKVADMHVAKEDAVLQAKEDYDKSLQEARAALRDRLAHEREVHDREFAAVTASYQENLQAHMKRKADELSELQRRYDALQATAEEERLLAERKLEDVKQQLATYRAALEGGGALASGAASDGSEVAKLREELRVTRAQHDEAMKDLKVAHQEALEALERRVQLVQHKYDGMAKDNAELGAALAEKKAELAAHIQAHQEQLERLDTEKYQAVEEAHQAERLKASLEGMSPKQEPDAAEGAQTDSEVTANLMERLKHMEMTATQLETRLAQETALLKAQLDAKEQRILSLITTSAHTAAVLLRNSELEEAFARDKENMQRLLQERAAQIASLDAAVAQKTRALEAAEAEKAALEQDVDQFAKATQRMEEEVRLHKLRAVQIDDLESKVAVHADEVAQLRERLESAERRAATQPQAAARRLETLKQLSAELTASRQETEKLHAELESFRSRAEETSRLALEASLLSNRIEAQEQTIESLRDRLAAKQAMVDELQQQLASHDTHHDDAAEDSMVPQLAETTERIDELSRQCLNLADQKMAYEQEKRALLHRMELEKQLLSQSIERKDRQLQQLVETNKRAEKLLARNAELEELLLTLTGELDKARSANAAAAAQHAAAASAQQTLAAADEDTSAEIEALRNLLMEREGQVQQLSTRVRELQALHAKEVEELTNRLWFASLESSQGNGTEADLLKLLVDKTAELQREVARLHRERDASLQALQAEKESLKAAAAAAAEAAAARAVGPGVDHDTAALLAEISLLETRLDALLAERASLQRRIGELVDQAKSPTSPADMAALRKQNDELQATVDKLTGVVDEHRATLDLLNRHAAAALQQNGTLEELVERLQCGANDERLLENILKRNLQLESLLESLQSASGYSERMTSSTAHARKFDDTVDAIQLRLNKVWSQVAELNAGSEPGRTTIEPKLSTASTTAPGTPHHPQSDRLGLTTPAAGTTPGETPLSSAMIVCPSDAPTMVPEDVLSGRSSPTDAPSLSLYKTLRRASEKPVETTTQKSDETGSVRRKRPRIESLSSPRHAGYKSKTDVSQHIVELSQDIPSMPPH